jgi:excisionase family DNA binding protein
MSDTTHWLGTKEASERLGVTLRTLYRFIDEGRLPAYQMGRVIRVKEEELDGFVESLRIAPGTLAHLYPDSRTDSSATEATGT